MKELRYKPVRNLPVARFYYQGPGHSHPVQRTVVIIEVTRTKITGYEIRDGSTVRALKNAKIKSFRRDKIAKIKQCGTRFRRRTPEKNLSNTTLKRSNWLDLVLNGA